jgi:hypothetical protein
MDNLGQETLGRVLRHNFVACGPAGLDAFEPIPTNANVIRNSIPLMDGLDLAILDIQE